MKRLRQWLSFALIMTGLRFFSLLPPGAGRWLGRIAWLLWGSRRRLAEENVRGALERGALPGDLDARKVVRQTFENFGRSLLEIGKCYFGKGGRIVENVEIRGLEHIEAVHREGRAILFVSGHCGNWELMNLVMPRYAGKGYGIARRQNNPYLNEALERVRSSYGTEIVYKEGALRKLMKVLREGHTAGIMVDQAVIEDEGIKVPFLGRPAWTVRVPVLLARKTGAAVIPIFIHRRKDEDGHVIKILPEIEMTGDAYTDLREIVARQEDYISSHPTEWLWIHARWKRT